MSELKFRDLIPPGEGAKMAMRTELHRRVKEWKLPGYHYDGGADLLLRHGTFFTGADLRPEYGHLRGIQSQCFASAWSAADQSDLRLFEGYYQIGAGIFMPHAWCVAPDGVVQDVTVGGLDAVGMIQGNIGTRISPLEQWAYWGVEIHPELYDHHVNDLQYDLPLLDRPKAELELQGQPIETMPGQVWDFTQNHDFPILKVPYDPDRRVY